MGHKYRAKPVYYDLRTDLVINKTEAELLKINYPSIYRNDLVYFASTLEFKTYQILRQRFTKSWIKPQYPIGIIEQGICYPEGKKWLIDFAIVNPNDCSIIALIEAKGVLTNEFVLSLALLEQTQLELFEKTYLVFERSIPVGNQLIKRLLRNPVYREQVVTLTQLKNTLCL